MINIAEIRAGMASGKRIYANFGARYLLIIVFISAGAAVFKAIEKTGVDDALQYSDKHKLAYKLQLEVLRQNLSKDLNVSVDALLFENLVNRLHSIKKPTEPKEWSWTEGFHFAFTIMSTVGYGDVVPKTDIGKVVCILYAILTIPLYLFALSAAGEVKRFHIEYLLRLIEGKLLKHSDIKQKKKKVAGISVVLFITEMLIASGTSSKIEGWTFLDSIYFWAITASTIGFGDIIADYNTNKGQLMSFNLLFTVILQADFATIFNQATEMLSKKEVGTTKNMATEQLECSNL